jgi:LAO/AO transport system kinase
MRDIELLARAVLARDRVAIGAALNIVEDRRPPARQEAAALLQTLRSSGAVDRGHRIGVTGPPGVGKSTLIAALARVLRSGTAGQAETVGVLAVDPTSVRSGGALLGDRTRIAPDPADEGLFVRSLATAGELGGLAPGAPLGLSVLAAAFDVAILETVGVGQSETDVRDVVDTLVFVLQPGSGDSLQYMKAGIMEIPDVLVVNKADEGSLAKRTERDVTAALASLRSAGIGDADIPLVMTSSLDGTGIVALARALWDHRAALARSGLLASRRRDGVLAWGMRAFARRYGEVGIERAGGVGPLCEAFEARLAAGREVVAIIEELGGGGS